MMSHHVRNTNFWQEFFRLYRSMPELWLANSKDYRNRKLKSQSYDRLLAHLRQADPNSNIHMLKRKINNLRTSYRRELRKVLESKSLGHGEEYVPSLWYYNELDFLYEEETGEAQTLLAPEHEYLKEHISDADDAAEENVENPPTMTVEADEDIFAEPYQPEEDMLVIEGVGEGEGEGEGEAEGAVVGAADVELEDDEEEEEGEEEEAIDAEHEHESQLKSPLKMSNKYHSHSNSNNNNSNNGNGNGIGNNNSNNHHINKHAYSRLHAHPHSHSHPHPYGTNQTQSLRRKANGNVAVGSNAAQAMRRRRRSSILDDYDDVGSTIAATSTSTSTASKKQRLMLDQMAISRSVEDAESECDLIGKRMAAHFRNMRSDQRLFAERIISEVLVYGRMNRLSLDARFLPNGNLSNISTPTATTMTASNKNHNNTSDDVYARDDVK